MLSGLSIFVRNVNACQTLKKFFVVHVVWTVWTRMAGILWQWEKVQLGWAARSELGRKISEYLGDPFDSRYFIQRVSVLIQWYNSILFHETFPADDEIEM